MKKLKAGLLFMVNVQCPRKVLRERERVKVVPGKRTPTHSPPPAKCTKAILLP